MFPDLLPKLNLVLGAIVAVFLSFGAGFITGDIHRGGADKKDQAIAVAKANDAARVQEQKMDVAQNIIEKSTLGEKNAIEAKRNQLIAHLGLGTQPANINGLRQPGAQLSGGQNSEAGAGGQALRLSEPDAISFKQFLTNFAAECAVSEAERNEVILKYGVVNSLGRE